VTKVSVVVPVYNPGRDIDDCIRTLLGQSLPREDYEVIFVDDGSTDETPARLDELAGSEPNVRVEHIPNSGWPGRPRNIGVDKARGEFVYFVDNDDWVAPEALERLLATANRTGADVVVGKVVGHGKRVPRRMFEESHDDVDLEWPPLLDLLTPHKLFRKSLLDAHGIRFPEGPRRLEDHIFVMHAYFHAQRVSILSDYACYHWMLRAVGDNASYGGFEPAGYYANVREVLDLVEEHTEPGPLRDRLLSHWYRGKMLGRLGPTLLRRDDDYAQTLYDEIRTLALERYGPQVDERLALHHRARSALLRAGDLDAQRELAAFEDGIQLKLVVRRQKRVGNVIRFRLRGTLRGPGGVLRFRRVGDRLRWIPPEHLAARLPEEILDATREIRRAQLHVLLQSSLDRVEWLITPARLRTKLVPVGDDPDVVRLKFLADYVLDPATAASGAPLPAGKWALFATVNVGFTARARLKRPLDGAERPFIVQTPEAGRLPELPVPLSTRVKRRVRRPLGNSAQRKQPA
jgi:glycosyltransferase involved in cell wall biosynthesis